MVTVGAMVTDIDHITATVDTSLNAQLLAAKNVAGILINTGTVLKSVQPLNFINKFQSLRSIGHKICNTKYCFRLMQCFCLLIEFYLILRIQKATAAL